jgi:TRAP-type C4-dicarboxylate transport system permease small subunit
MLYRFHEIIDRILYVYVGLSLGVLVFLAFAQVVGRYFFGQSYGWIEEVSVLILCWTAWISACLLIREKRHLAVTLLVDRLPGRVRHFVHLSMGIIVLIFLAFIIYASKGTIEAMGGIRFVTLSIPVNTKFYSVPVGAFLLAYYVIRCWLFDFRGTIDGDR